MLKRLHLILLLCTIPLLLSGCLGSMLNGEPSLPDFKEQLYIDARLDFTIKHPLDWKRQQIPVSSPEYRPDSVIWKVQDPTKKSHDSGEMLVRCTPANPDKKLADLLNDYLAEHANLRPGKAEPFIHPVGKALKLVTDNSARGDLIIAIKGQKKDFLIAIDFPSQNFSNLLPIFLDIVNSFTEVLPPSTAAL